MLLMGQEFEERGWQSWETLFEPSALGWPPADSATLAHYRALIGLRARHGALRRGEVRFVPAGADRVVRYWWALAAERLCVSANRRAPQQSQKEQAMKTILCYGDSNTWGCPPVQPGQAVERYGSDVRWGSVLRTALGSGYWVVEEGLGGRTTLWDDPIEGEHKNGKRYLLPCLESHAPIDLVALMLGTNDLKQRFGLSAADIAAGAGALVDIILRSACGPKNAPPMVLLICPPPTAQLSGFAELFAGAGEKSRAFAASYQREADLRGCAFLDAGQIIGSSQQDGIHLEADAHRTLGCAVARSVQKLLGA